MAQEDEEGEEGIKYKTVFYCIFRFSSNYNVSSSINKQDKKEVITSENTQKKTLLFLLPLVFLVESLEILLYCVVY